MLNIALFQPEIPPNTGNIIRLCANTGFTLHLIRPFGFTFGHKELKRAGMDYTRQAKVVFHHNFEAFKHTMQDTIANKRLFALTTKATTNYCDIIYKEGDILLLGPETRGLPDEVLTLLEEQQKLKIPMLPESRSLNLANSAAIASYEAWRQLQFKNSGI